MARNTTARIIEGQPSPDDDRPGFYVETPYDEDWIDELKGELPLGDRRWMSWEKAWWVHDDHRDYVEELTIHHFGSVEIVDEDGEIEVRSPGARTRQGRLF